MATPTTLPATFVSGDILTAAQMNNLRGAFRILQVLSASTSTQVTSASATFVDVGLSVSITPQSTSSKILLINAQTVYSTGGPIDSDIRFVRDATNIYTSRNAIIPTSAMGLSISNIYLDSPSSTSPMTYKVQGARTAGTGTVLYQVSGVCTSSLIVMEISA